MTFGDDAGDLGGESIQIGNFDVSIENIQISAFNNTDNGVTFDVYSRASSEKSVGHRYVQRAPEARPEQPANPMWDSAASAFPVRSQLPFELVCSLR